MVHVELADMDWLEVAVFPVVLLVDCIWVSILNDGALVDCVAPVSTGKRLKSSVAYLDFCRSAD